MLVFNHNGLTFGIQLNGLNTLLLPQWVRHTRTGQNSIVPTVRTSWVFIEAAHIGVQVVCTLRSGNQGQIRRRSTQPFGSIFRIHCRYHDIANIVCCEHQVFLDFIFSQTDVFQTIEAHTACRVARQTVVCKDLRTVLQADLVTQVDIDFFIVCMAAAGDGCTHRHCQQ